MNYVKCCPAALDLISCNLQYLKCDGRAFVSKTNGNMYLTAPGVRIAMPPMLDVYVCGGVGNTKEEECNSIASVIRTNYA